MLKVILTLLATFYFSFLINVIQQFWDVVPIKEEKSTPIYVTKELKSDGTF